VHRWTLKYIKASFETRFIYANGIVATEQVAATREASAMKNVYVS